jgi:hypothetical protein
MASSARHPSRPRTVIRIVLAVLGAMVLAGAIVFIPLAGYALLSPFSGVPVPAACQGGTAGPSLRPVELDGYGQGEVGFIGSPGPPIQAVGIPFGAVVDGCLVTAVG